MEREKIIVAVDGYSSTGKSSFAKLIAQKLGYVYIDTGAMYRAVTYFAYTNGFIDNKCVIDNEGLKHTLNNVDIMFRTTGRDGASETYFNGANIEKKIRQMEISKKVSHISALPFVRDYVDVRLRRMGEGKGVVMDGRDIGTALFPKAELKIFMTATVQIRAERRFKELTEKGFKGSFEEVLQNLKERDYIDEHREVAPLTKAPDAIVLDNTNMTIREQMVWLKALLNGRFGMDIDATV